MFVTEINRIFWRKGFLIWTTEQGRISSRIVPKGLTQLIPTQRVPIIPGLKQQVFNEFTLKSSTKIWQCSTKDILLKNFYHFKIKWNKGSVVFKKKYVNKMVNLQMCYFKVNNINYLVIVFNLRCCDSFNCFKFNK